MNILLVNDDGFDAKGLEVMAHALSHFGKVYVCAPKFHQSAKSHAISIANRILIEKTTNVKYATRTIKVDGTPADCVRVGLKYFDVDFDLVVSGINQGNNVGKNIIYSGTVAAALEGKILGVNSIAFSADSIELDYIFDECVKIIDELLENKLHEGNYILSINFPSKTFEKPLGVKITHQGKRYLHAEYIESEKENIYFVKYSQVEYMESDNSDISAFENGYISITPIIEDRTNYEAFENLIDKY